MNLVYYCSKYTDAPGTVCKFIFQSLHDSDVIVPFRDIFLYGQNNCNDSYVGKFNLHLFRWSNFLKKKDFIVHVAVSPNIFPNRKLLLILSSILFRRPLIIHYHGDVRKHLLFVLKHQKKVKLLDLVNALFIPIILKLSDRVVVHSYLMEKIIETYGVKKRIVIPNGIEDFWFEPSTNQPKTSHSTLLEQISVSKKIFYHGRLSPEKGVDILLEAFSMYFKSHDDSYLLIAGDGIQSDHLEQLAGELGLTNNVVFLGNLSKEDIKYFLKNVDVAIYPSRFDAFCLAAVEALACSNCPVYFSEITGLNDFVISSEFKLNSFVPNIENILDILYSTNCNFSENDLLSQRKFSENFKWTLLINEYVSLYQDVVYNESC